MQENISRETLEASHISWDSALPAAGDSLPGNVVLPAEKDDVQAKQAVMQLMADYNSGKPEREQIDAAVHASEVERSSDDCVYISIDDVGVKHQKVHRKAEKEEKTAYVENTVVHVQNAGRSYIITDIGMFKAMRQLLAFLLRNGLLKGKRLIFLSDGAQNIRIALERYFAFYPYRLYLDWYHLEKRMTELLSLALRGDKEARHRIRTELDRILWAGNIGAAMQYLKEIAPENIKNQKRLDEAVEYLERKSPYIYCYAIRAMLKYRNSSNPAEKANDLIVAQRQKHNGMSWSFKGSGALALLSALIKNKESDSWITRNQIAFTFAQGS